MKPIFELEGILQQDAHEDGLNDGTNEQQTIMERPRTYSDSSMNSIDGDDNISAIALKKQLNKNHLGIIASSTAMINNEPQPLFSNDIELYGTQLVNPLLFLSSS
jgi:hypothetical protein